MQDAHTMKLQDQIHDQNPTPIFYLEEQGILPDFAKDASAPPDDLSDAGWAMPDKRLFPLHDKSATYRSIAYFHGKGLSNTYPDVAQRLKQAAESYDLVEHHDVLRDLFRAQVKQASEPETLYALAVNMGQSMGDQQFYPMNDSLELELSMDMVRKDASEGRLPLELQREASLALCKRASELGYDPQDIPLAISSLGVPRVPNYDHADSCAGLRKLAGVPTEALDMYRELVKAARADAENIGSMQEEQEMVEKYAELMLELDRNCGIQSYDNNVVDPYTSFFFGTPVSEIKAAAEQMLFLGDTMVPMCALQAIPDQKLDVRFSKVASQAIKSMKGGSTYDANHAIGLMNEADVQELLDLSIQYG